MAVSWDFTFLGVKEAAREELKPFDKILSKGIDMLVLWPYVIVMINDYYGGHMKDTSVSVAKGKKNFSQLLKKASEEKEEITITKRGKPVAVLVPYKEYKKNQRLNAYQKIKEARKHFTRAGIGAEDTYKRSKKQLEEKS